MSTRNFEFRVTPQSGQRSGRFAASAAIVIGAPVKADVAQAPGDLGLQEVDLATGAQAPLKGLSGIMVYEHKGAEGWAGDDPFLTTYSDKDTCPSGAAVQVVSGDDVKVCFRNTNDVTFLNTRDYTGTTMVSEGAGSTPNVNVGDFLTPGVGTRTDGFWAVTSVEANAWLVVTAVDDARGEVEARFVF
jgi:hypothetical protein